MMDTEEEEEDLCWAEFEVCSGREEGHQRVVSGR